MWHTRLEIEDFTEKKKPHIIASYTIIRQMRPTLLHTLQKVSVVYDEYLLSYSRKSVIVMFPNAL